MLILLLRNLRSYSELAEETDGRIPTLKCNGESIMRGDYVKITQIIIIIIIIIIITKTST